MSYLEKDVSFAGRSARILYREYSTSDLQVISEVWENDTYQVGAMQDFPIRTILDIGANIGAFSLLASKVWPDAEILAVEPEMDNFLTLQANLEGTGARTLSYALTDHDGRIWLNPYFANSQIADQGDLRDTYGLTASPWRDLAWGLVPDHEGAVQQQVFCKTLDRALDDVRFGGTVDLVKIDIEGAELEVFQSFTDWNRIKYLTMECHSLDDFPTNFYVDILQDTHDMLFVSRTDLLAVRKQSSTKSNQRSK